MCSLEVLWKALLLLPQAERLRAEAQSLARAHPQQQAEKSAPASISSQLFRAKLSEQKPQTHSSSFSENLSVWGQGNTELSSVNTYQLSRVCENFCSLALYPIARRAACPGIWWCYWQLLHWDQKRKLAPGRRQDFCENWFSKNILQASTRLNHFSFIILVHSYRAMSFLLPEPRNAPFPSTSLSTTALPSFCSLWSQTATKNLVTGTMSH